MSTTATHQFQTGDMVKASYGDGNRWLGRVFDGIITFVDQNSRVALVHHGRGRSEQVPLRYLTLRVGSPSYFEGGNK